MRVTATGARINPDAPTTPPHPPTYLDVDLRQRLVAADSLPRERLVQALTAKGANLSVLKVAERHRARWAIVARWARRTPLDRKPAAQPAPGTCVHRRRHRAGAVRPCRHGRLGLGLGLGPGHPADVEAVFVLGEVVPEDAKA